MRVGIISVFTDYHRRGAPHRGALQPQIGPLIAALLPDGIEIDVVNDTWTDPDWERDYDLVFLSCMHADFDRARQISHYYRRRGARTVLGGIMASTYPDLVAPYFDAVVIGDPETTVPALFRDFCARDLQPLYRAGPDPLAMRPVPRIDLVRHQSRVPLGLELTRGCPYQCDFCALTAFGTRFLTPALDRVVSDLRAARKRLGRHSGWLTRNVAMFYDNNLGGHPAYLRALCERLEPLGLRWASCVTFNVITRPDLVRALYRAGCRSVFVGLESFDAVALADMAKPQNNVNKMRDALALCRDEGILVMAGLMCSPLIDDCAAIESLPTKLREVGLHVPSFLAFETPIPGTPFFSRLACAPEPAFLPNALLRDFSGYTLTVRPRRASPEAFAAAYAQTLAQLYRPAARIAKLADDLPRLLRRGSLLAALVDVLDQWSAVHDPAPGRTYLAGTDRPPPEQVPLTEADFESHAEMARIMSPWAVTDVRGAPLPQWLAPRAFADAPPVQTPHTDAEGIPAIAPRAVPAGLAEAMP